MAPNRDALKNAAGAALNGDRGSRGRETTDEMAEVLFGDLRRGESGRVNALPISINQIIPDQSQPRRALPTAVRQVWDGDPATLPHLFHEWINAAPEYRLMIGQILDGQEGERPAVLPPLVSALVEIADLAASIRRDGLTNPITAVKRGEMHVIETGERRWLAYHLLTAHTGEDKWTRIPARIVEQFSRWRQAAENNTRQDLNAIGKARQLAVLLMELVPDAAEFLPIDSWGHEQQFYAQVADGETFRTPRGKGQLLLNAMGLSHPDQIRQYRALLRLSREVWDMADDGNWSIAEINQYRDLNHGNAISQAPAVGKKATPPSKRFVPLMDDETLAQVKTFRNITAEVEGYEAPMRQRIAEQAELLAKYFADVAKRARG
jgi:hypothetical protein